MKKIYKNTLIFILFFFAFIFKDYFYMLIGTINSNNTNGINAVVTNILKTENKELRRELKKALELHNIEFQSDFDYEIARVLIRNPFTFNDTMIISNTNNKHRIGDAVVGPNGLIGRIGEVNNKTSRVDLLTKPNNDISIIVHSSYGILSGFSKQHNCLIIRNLNNYVNVEIGDLIYTSGLSILPGGILIGKVSSINYDRFNIEKSLCVEMKESLNNINYVGVIKK